MPFGVDLQHYKSQLNWPDVAKSNTPTGFYCVYEFSVDDEFAFPCKLTSDPRGSEVTAEFFF